MFLEKKPPSLTSHWPEPRYGLTPDQSLAKENGLAMTGLGQSRLVVMGAMAEFRASPCTLLGDTRTSEHWPQEGQQGRPQGMQQKTHRLKPSVSFHWFLD